MLAILDKKDRWHEICVESFQQLRLPLLTSDGFLTELFHLVGGNRREVDAAWKFVRSGAVELVAIAHAEMPQIQGLMARYWDRPMDFEDATLVHLAARESLSVTIAVDHEDFETYRIAGRRRFRVIPAKQP